MTFAPAPRAQLPFIEREGQWLYWLAVLWLGCLTAVPVFLLARTGLAGDSAVDLAALVSAWMRPSTQKAAFNSLTTSLGAAALSVALGLAVALLLMLTNVRGKRAFAFLFCLSMMIAPQVAALAFKTLLGPASPVLQALGLAPEPGSRNPLLGFWGILIVLGLHHAPIVALTVIAGLRSIPHHLIEAAQLDGASPLRISRQIIAPLIRGHIMAGALLAFVAAFGNFGIPALLGLPVNVLTLPTLIYRELSSFGPEMLGEVARIALLMAILAALVLLATSRLTPPNAMALERDTPLKPFWNLGRSSRMSAELALVVITLVVLGLPVLSLLSTSITRAYGVPLSLETLSAESYREILFRQAATYEAFRTSTSLSLAAGGILALASVPIALAVTRFARRSRGVLMILIDIPYALPGVVIAIAMILAFLRPLPLIGVSLYATPAIILLAYCSRFLALALKPVQATLLQAAPEIEEAGAICGAGFLRRLATLLVPQILPAMMVGGLMVFLIAFNELTVSALLWSAGSRTLGVVLYGLEEAGLTPQASALGIVIIGIVILLMSVIDRLGRSLPHGAIPWDIAETDG